MREGVAPREVLAWAFLDFANSGYTTVVITAVFNAYFVSVVAGNAAWATFAWTASLAISYAAIIATAPLAGAWADLHAAKKQLLAITTAGCVLGTGALALVGPGELWLGGGSTYDGPTLLENARTVISEPLSQVFSSGARPA